MINEDPATSQLNRVFGNVAVDWDVNEWLSIKDNLGADYYNDERTEALALTSSSFPTGQVTVGNNSIYSLDNYLTATGTKTFSPNFSGSLTLGTDMQSQSVTQVFTTGQTLVAPLPYTLSNTVTYIPTTYAVAAPFALVLCACDGGHVQSALCHARRPPRRLLVVRRERAVGLVSAGEPGVDVHHAPWGTRSRRATFSYGKLRVGYGETGKPPAPYSTQTVLAAGATTLLRVGLRRLPQRRAERLRRPA